MLAMVAMTLESSPDVRVLYTRDTDEFIELGERSAFANRNNADLFISIHCNSTPNSHSVRGTETYVMGLHKTNGNLEVAKRENSVILKETNYKQKYKGFDPDSPLAAIMLANYQSAFISSSLRFADHVEKKFRTISDRSSRGVKQAGFLVLWRTTMPSVLIETGFLSTPEEEEYLNSEEGQDEVAESIVEAFKVYKRQMDS
jgi:N-acetylmuramoyl-L-alanine amidase